MLRCDTVRGQEAALTIRNLDLALGPRSVAVIGAEGGLGARVLGNLLDGGFAGPVWPVAEGLARLRGRDCVARIADLPGVPDVAVVASPPETLPEVIGALGARGCRLAVVVSGGEPDPGLKLAMLAAARPYLLRVIGPNALGLVAPAVKFNASHAPCGANAGTVALVAQSGTIAATVLDWAADRGIGFSHVVSLGEMADVDVADWLDLLAGDGRTRAILVYLEGIPEARKFISAARAAARLKPVIAVKAGRSPEAARAAETHSGALTGADAVADAALRRAGILRVTGLGDLFAAAETVGRFRPLAGARLGIVTNSGGAGVLAVDRLFEQQGALGGLAPETLARLDAALGEGSWSRGNPVDIGGFSPPARYVAALEAVAGDPGVDALLVMNCPTVPGAPVAVAEAVAGRVAKGMIDGKPLFACWMGGAAAREGRAILRASGIASYDAPAAAAAAVQHLTAWGRAQTALLHVPDRATEAALAATPAAEARAVVAGIFAAVAAEKRRLLTAPEATAVMEAYGVPVAPLRVAGTVEAVAALAEEMLRESRALVVKLVSRDVAHKSDLGGVVLDVTSAAGAEAAARSIAAGLAEGQPGARLDGFALSPMLRRGDAQELILGVGRDPVFGPVILFGAGGVATEVFRDTAVALPPLDSGLAADLIGRTRAGRVLAGFRGHAPADTAAVGAALIALSHLVEDFPCLRSLDVNPLIADADGVLALDARIEIEPGDMLRRAPNPDLAIRPYPAAWRRSFAVGDETWELRPVRPADALLYPDFMARVAAEDLRRRFMAAVRSLPEQMALRLTQLDYDRDMAFVALTPAGELAGVSRISSDPDRRVAEYALLVRSDLAGRGLGTQLMTILIDYARATGLERLDGPVLADNRGMQGLVRRLGFEIARDPDDPGVVMSRLVL